MEAEYVHKTYETISDEFNKTRHSPWPSVIDFINSLYPHSIVLDAGCGNGKNMQIRNDLKFVGCDTSDSLLKICKDKGLNVLNANIKELPFPDNHFDAIICIAVLHHIYEEKDRLLALNELLRVLKPGKRLMFQVWAREQTLTKKFSKVTNSNTNDYFVSWQKKDNELTKVADAVEVKRYYHLFSELEIKVLLAQLYGVTVIKKEYEKDNWIIVLEKKS